MLLCLSSFSLFLTDTLLPRRTVTHTHTQVKHIKPGDRVVSAFDIACGSCRSCSREAFSCCDATNPSKDQEMLYGARYVLPYILPVPYSHSPWGSSGHSVRCSFSLVSEMLCWQLGTTPAQSIRC